VDPVSAPPAVCPPLVPAYVSPRELMDLAGDRHASRLIVINPEDGPGGVPQPDFRAAVGVAHDNGSRVLGYVPTDYGARPVRNVLDEVDRHIWWYGVDGIFFDETAAEADRLLHYGVLTRRVRARRRAVVLNPGVVPARGYLDLADLVVTFEGHHRDHRAALRRTPRWLRRLPPGRVVHLVYGATRDEALAAVRAAGPAARVYATSGELPNPWCTLPPYLHEQEEALRACS
jgi:hypothetical protein